MYNQSHTVCSIEIESMKTTEAALITRCRGAMIHMDIMIKDIMIKDIMIKDIMIKVFTDGHNDKLHNEKGL